MTKPASSPAPAATPTLQTRSFDPREITPTDCYKILAGAVVPRPIAFVSSRDTKGILNLAPFSWFTAASSNPPVLVFCTSVREAKNGLSPHKDTLENVRATGEFVINVVSEEIAEAMNQTAAQVPPEVDEFALAGLTPAPSEVVRVPRVAESKVQFECRLKQIVEVSTLPGGGVLVLGDVVRFHLREDVLGERFHIKPEELRAVGRLAGSEYVHTDARFALERPE